MQHLKHPQDRADQALQEWAGIKIVPSREAASSSE